MGREIERKFLVASDGWRASATGVVMRQGYLSTDPDRTVRVRIAGERAWLTIKGRARGAVRAEYEYEIPAADAGELLALCPGPLVEKTRYRVAHGGRTWEVDEFAGANAPLVLAEIELEREDATVALPAWLGAEVTDDPRYANANLAVRPHSTW